ncbi:inositol monophosphatase family protein [Bacillus tuaregi]|uniref:inositol monophosphatase family protein n=1 Tax=Bacillus tuaregi TaxID=1816695 RepID=UPI0008F9525B|nr:inositol monophosphatase family protein [Bacillus tuaregi]
MTNWSDVEANAKNWMNQAAQMIKNSFNKTLDIQTKSNRNDLVTEMDKSIEQFFIAKIRQHYPGHKIIGEEGFGDSPEILEGIIWMIDPIDGTMNFVHMQRNFAISIGIYENGVGMIGLIYDVVSDELYYAVKGKGAYMNDTRLNQLEQVKLSDSIIGINATWVIENNRIDSGILAPLVKKGRGTRSYGCAALEFAYVAAGRLDAYISLRLSPWDFAAGKILVEELGGVVTDLRGKPLNMLEQCSIFIAKPGLYDEIFENYLQKGSW